MMVKITAPKNFNMTIVGLEFKNGVAMTKDEARIEFFRNRHYKIEEVTETKPVKKEKEKKSDKAKD